MFLNGSEGNLSSDLYSLTVNALVVSMFSGSQRHLILRVLQVQYVIQLKCSLYYT